MPTTEISTSRPKSSVFAAPISPFAMDDLEFDFEDDINATDVGQPQQAPETLPDRARKNYRQTVCRHWLRGLCMKGNDCGFLHQFDKQRMPTCRFFAKYNECKEPDCPFKHSLEDVKDCNMYKLGFCIHGPNCRYRHPRSDGAPPDIAEAALFGRPGHLHGAAPRHVRQQQSALLAMRQQQQLAAPPPGSGPAGRPGDGSGGFAPPPLPPGPPPSSVRRMETTQALPDRPGAGDGNPFSEPPLAGGAMPGMPGAA